MTLALHHLDELMPWHRGLVQIRLWIESPGNFIKYIGGNLYSFNTLLFHCSNEFSSRGILYLECNSGYGSFPFIILCFG